MEQPNQKIIDRIAKMLRLAQNDGATEGERDNALRMAHATLAKYNLDISQVELDTGKKTTGEARTNHAETFFGRTPWARTVASDIARMLFCKYYYVPSRYDRTNVAHTFVGRQSNAVSAGLIAKFVVGSIMKEAKQREKTSSDPHFAKEFCLGAAFQVKARVDKILAESVAPAPVKGPGTALVLASVYQTEGVENGKFLATIGIVTKKAPVRAIVRGGTDAHAQGRVYGSSVSLNHQIK